jgi:hypothetical protein
VIAPTVADHAGPVACGESSPEVLVAHERPAVQGACVCAESGPTGGTDRPESGPVGFGPGRRAAKVGTFVQLNLVHDVGAQADPCDRS